MINILIPLAGKSRLFEDVYFPKPLFEINNHLMIEYPIVNLNAIKGDKRFIFIVREEECVKFHLDKTLKLLTSPDTIVIRQKSDTMGAACSALLAIDHINNDDSLIISNGDQYLDIDYNIPLEYFYLNHLGGGVICFDSVHPQWSYAMLDENDNIIQTAEKTPISRNAIAGFYYFQAGKDFVVAAQRSIEREGHFQGMYYIAPVYNELILEAKKLKAYKINSDKYFSFYSFPRIRDFEKHNIKIDML